MIEVSAENTQRSGCLTYRKKEVIVTSNARPYFNPLSFTDGSNNVLVTLENNDVYKYTRPETSHFIEIEVLNADTCQYKVNNGTANNLSCDGELIQISSSGTGCISGTITLIASNNHGESHSQSYYYYCGENDNYCYFGPVSQQVGSQICPIVIASKQGAIPINRDPSSVTTTTTAQKIIGRCGSYQGDSDASCAAGNFNNHPGHTNTQYQWTCRSIPHTNPNREVECSEAKPTPPVTQRPPTTVTCGRCGDSNGICAAGDSHNHPLDTTTEWLWTCRNSPHETGQCGSKSDRCSKAKPQQACTCGNTRGTPCSSGCSATNKNRHPRSTTEHSVDFVITVITFDCVGTNYTTVTGCNYEERKCTGHDDGCLDGGRRINGRLWPPKSCSTDSYGSSCKMTVCDRSISRNCDCVELNCKAEPPNN